MKRGIILCFAFILFFMGIVIISYPYLHGSQLEENIDNTAESFIEKHAPEPKNEAATSPEPTPMPYAELYEAMKAYNEEIYLAGQDSMKEISDCTEPSFDLTAYGVSDNVMGVLTIPAIELEMPVYLGANEDNLAAGAAHLSQTSLPVGGTNTNCVIAGHRGWYSAPYFLNIVDLQEGDELSLITLWDTLEYEVCEVKIIEPNDIEEIFIQKGRELLTLMTCHPPNTGGKYRYLVFCERMI